ncbi:hypothetical protein BJ742DRAFT_768095 [Cladochytrium replicatum]|nr:hypothetical protein BJ742DRAFT_768095 [Cladochytrium replicatum]
MERLHTILEFVQGLINDAVDDQLSVIVPEILKNLGNEYILSRRSEQVFEQLFVETLNEFNMYQHAIDEHRTFYLFDVVTNEVIEDFIVREAFYAAKQLNRKIYQHKSRRKKLEAELAPPYVHPNHRRQSYPFIREPFPSGTGLPAVRSRTLDIAMERIVDRLMFQRLAMHFQSDGMLMTVTDLTERIVDGMIFKQVLLKYASLRGIMQTEDGPHSPNPLENEDASNENSKRKRQLTLSSRPHPIHQHPSDFLNSISRLSSRE